ncbi:hypothetical protein PROFUN_00878 [Planoprotostelium fungivorum]|uniref:Uncharacterized protein n=1 Tax=Planoprotostelium fungivorum TaxID=1890364 RepID=A0A2P6P093_9EUKA|nr:hypothetical protein PROFUN_00878 [Planoprotostelium fungivorum]
MSTYIVSSRLCEMNAGSTLNGHGVPIFSIVPFDITSIRDTTTNWLCFATVTKRWHVLMRGTTVGVLSERRTVRNTHRYRIRGEKAGGHYNRIEKPRRQQQQQRKWQDSFASLMGEVEEMALELKVDTMLRVQEITEQERRTNRNSAPPELASWRNALPGNRRRVRHESPISLTRCGLTMSG